MIIVFRDNPYSHFTSKVIKACYSIPTKCNSFHVVSRYSSFCNDKKGNEANIGVM